MRFVSLFFMLVCNLLIAQNQNNTWLFGTFLGMKFNAGKMTVLKDKASNMYASSACASISNPNTGNLLFYTNGNNVWDKNNQQMPNGDLSLNIGFSPFCLIVPASTNSYFIFYTNQSDQIYYALVDMKLNNGNGDLLYKDKLLAGEMDLQFTAVKMFNDQGHWLITHKKGTNQFHSYAITRNQISATPVISAQGSSTFQNTSFYYGKMITDLRGTKLAYTFYDSDINNSLGCVTEEFLIDKKCGTLTLHKQVLNDFRNTFPRMSFICYDSSAKFLYTSYYMSSDQSSLYQYNMQQNNPGESKVLLSTSAEIIGNMQLGGDGKIYVASSENRTYTSRVSIIAKPWLSGAACQFQQNVLQLSSAPFLGSIGVEHFPTFVSDISIDKPIALAPIFKINSACAGSTSTFSLQLPEALIYDSVKWDFGDTNFANSITVEHIYKYAAKFPVVFSWFVCGIKHTITDTVNIIERTPFSIGNDTTLCNGIKLKLSAPTSEKYVWNTNDTLQTILVDKPGKYQVTISNGNCSSSDSINISYYPSIATTLASDYFICEDDNELVKLDAGEGFDKYKWTPTQDTTQWIIVKSIGDYFVQVIDYFGCPGNDDTKVKRKCDALMFFPNSFTPNNDGINDTYVPKGLDVAEYSLTIYNSWGQAIFKTNSLATTWDGYYKNQASPSGNYIYIAQYKGFKNKRLQIFNAKGNITLLR